MNIFDLDNKIYGNRKNRQGKSADLIIQNIEEQEMSKMDFSNYNNSTNLDFNKITKEIKF